MNSRERSCLLRCSLLLKARLQNWHLYFFSAVDCLRIGEEDGGARAAAVAAGGIAANGVECPGLRVRPLQYL